MTLIQKFWLNIAYIEMREWVDLKSLTHLYAATDSYVPLSCNSANLLDVTYSKSSTMNLFIKAQWFSQSAVGGSAYVHRQTTCIPVYLMCVHTHKSMCLCVYVYTCMYVCFVHMYLYVFKCTYVSVYMCMFMYMCF